MDRMKALYLAVAVLVMGGVMFVIALFQSEMHVRGDDESVSYQEAHRYIYRIGETAYLSSEDDSEGGAYGWYAGFDWEGTLAVTVEKVVVYRDESGSNDFSALLDAEARELIADSSEPVAYVEATLRIKNIDAVSRTEDEKFNASVFPLQESITGDIPFVDPGEAALDNPTVKDKYKYYLEAGEEASIRIGWFVEESSLSDDLTITAGASGNDKYSFIISPGDREGA